MRIIDNVNELLGDDLKSELGKNSKLRIAASTFSIFAFEALRKELEQVDELQFIFTAHHVLAAGGALEIIVPAVDYESTFIDAEDRTNYEELLAGAARVEICPFTDPSESAFLYAGRRVVDRCDTLIAIWDGAPARGRGGTADIVSYARSIGRDVEIVWPSDTKR